MRRVCISIDLDSIYCYQNIFDLPVDERDNTIYDIGLTRFAELLERFNFRGTLFTVARDLDMGDNVATLKDLAARGHEIGNHTQNHDYRLTRMDADAMRAEVAGGRRTLEDRLGVSVTGFRAPGYNVNPALLNTVLDSGHRYDSSVFPCLPYYGTKAAVLAAMRLTGKQSKSILGDARVLAAPLGPYRTTPERWHKKQASGSLIELPISTSPVLRFPFLGSFIILMGTRWISTLYRMLKASSDTLVLEFHGMDFIDGVGDGLDEALIRQPDMRVDWATKKELFERLFEMIAASGEVATLDEVARSAS